MAFEYFLRKYILTQKKKVKIHECAMRLENTILNKVYAISMKCRGEKNIN